MSDLNASGDSSNYISAEAYELIGYLYYAWGVYLEKNERKEVKREYKAIRSMMNDEEIPCKGCHSYSLCQEDNYECRHFRQWKDTGKWDKNSCSWK